LVCQQPLGKSGLPETRSSGDPYPNQEEKITARLVWENVKGQVVSTAQGYVAFDDTVLDHNSSFKIELVRRQYSGNAHDVIKGIGVVTCVYVNPETDPFWIIDYRIYDPDRDGKTKLDHVREMLDNALYDKRLPFRGVLMDSWYAERKLMLHIEALHKVSAAWLVEHSGFSRGYSSGAAGISRRHALAIVNRGGAAASEVVALAREVRERVHERFGVTLVPEPVFVNVSLD